MGKNSQPTKLKVFRVGALRLKKIILAVLPGRLKNSLRGKALFNGRRHTSVAWLFIISTISCTICRIVPACILQLEGLANFDENILPVIVFSPTQTDIN